MKTDPTLEVQGRQIDLRTGMPYANLIRGQKRFASIVAEHFAVSPSDVVPTPGATGAIEAVRNHLFRTAGKPHPRLLTVSPGYWRARESFLGFGFAVIDVKTEAAGFDIDEGALIEKAAETQPDLVYLSLPNNPTGALFDAVRIVTGMPESAGIVFDLTLPGVQLNVRELTGRLWRSFRGRSNLFLVGSTSKTHNTAEYRIGWAICAGAGDAAALQNENRNVVSSVAVDHASRQLQKACPTHSLIAQSFSLLKSAADTAGFRLVEPPRKTESSYVLIRLCRDPRKCRNVLERHGIAVMWGSEFGLTDEYVRLETSEPENVRALIKALKACLAEGRSA